MTVLLLVWGIIFFVARKKGLLDKLSHSEQGLYHFIIITYPIFETIIKYLLVENVIPGSWIWLNRVEHFLSAIGIQMLFYPFLKSTLIKLKKLEQYIFITSFTVLVGNLNEFAEYFIRIGMNLTDVYSFSSYYSDTIYDMIVNTFGATAGYFLITRVQDSYEKALLQRYNSRIK
ncbi:MAG: hypothetical protein PHS44_06285 [Candidatus Dojkabacteria bacterium]|nr:hypothetical protein [Candidatus Dojkabacteria bacterium]